MTADREPQTEAGRALIAAWNYGYDWQTIHDGILAIEAEARADAAREAPRFDHDGTHPHHHDFETHEPIWWQSSQGRVMTGSKRPHRHQHLAARGAQPDPRVEALRPWLVHGTLCPGGMETCDCGLVRALATPAPPPAGIDVEDDR